MTEAKPTQPSPRRRGRILKIVRRTHMYLGLLLLPFIALYGLSGILFNHPNLFETVQAQRVAPSELKGLSPWQAQPAAKAVVAALNQEQGRDYQLDPSVVPEFSGFTMLQAPAPDGRYLMFVNIERGAGVLVKRTPRAGRPDAFETTQVSVPSHAMAAVETAAKDVLADKGYPVVEPLRAHPKIAPQLRFVVRDDAGKRWNLVYHTYDGELTGRAADRDQNIGISRVLAMLHTTHHFPLKAGPLFFWALFQDLLGAAMLLWSITGLVMWWQMRKTRVMGLAALVLALVLAAWVTLGTSDHLLFDYLPPQLGPG